MSNQEFVALLESLGYEKLKSKLFAKVSEFSLYKKIRRDMAVELYIDGERVHGYVVYKFYASPISWGFTDKEIGIAGFQSGVSYSDLCTVIHKTVRDIDADSNCEHAGEEVKL